MYKLNNVRLLVESMMINHKIINSQTNIPVRKTSVEQSSGHNSPLTLPVAANSTDQLTAIFIDKIFSFTDNASPYFNDRDNFRYFILRYNTIFYIRYIVHKSYEMI